MLRKMNEHESLKFNSENYEVQLEYASMPVINIIRASFSTDVKDETWIDRLKTIKAKVTIEAYGENGVSLALSTSVMTFQDFVPNTIKIPFLEINRTFSFQDFDQSRPLNLSTVMEWGLVISLKDIQFKEGESLSLEYKINDVAAL
jgi:hypothetical protein